MTGGEGKARDQVGGRVGSGGEASAVQVTRCAELTESSPFDMDNVIKTGGYQQSEMGAMSNNE